MEELDLKPDQIICLQTNEELIDLETLRKVLLSLLDFRAYLQKIGESNEKFRFDIETLETRFAEAVGSHESLLQRYLSDEWGATEDYANALEQFVDQNQIETDQGFVVEASGEMMPDPSGSYTLGEKKDMMAIAAAEVVTHSYRDGLYICGWEGCKYQTSSRRHINNHKLVHTGDSEYNCTFGVCGKRFKTQNELDQHSQIHNSDEPYPCVWPNCEYRSSTPACLKAHMKVHMDKKFTCSYPNCNKEFSKEAERNEHQRIHFETSSTDMENAPNTTARNSAASTSQVTLVSSTGQPLQIISNPPNGQISAGQQVTLVQMQPPPQPAQGSNIKAVHPQQNSIPNTAIVLNASSSDTLAQNSSSTTATTPSVTVNTVNSSTGQPISTSIMANQLFKCPIESCNAYFSTIYDLKQHQPSHTKSEKPWKCDYESCDYSAYSKTALNEHKITHSNERNFQCPIEGCGRKYKTRKGLWDHQHTHRSDKPFACSFPNCSYKAVSSSYLRSHMRAHKEHNTPAKDNIVMLPVPAQNGVMQAAQLQPSVGGASMIQVSKTGTSVPQVVNSSSGQPQQQFFAPGTIIQHPNGRQEFFCGILGCGQSFDNQSNYLNHVKTHAPVNNLNNVAPIQAIPAPIQPIAPPPPPPPKNRSRNPELAKFKCEFEGCTSAYKLKRNLKDHMIRHTILEKPYRCNWPGCDYGSYKSTNVAKHKSVHSDERKYGCDCFNCTKRFKTREGLRKHMLSHHKINRADIP